MALTSSAAAANIGRLLINQLIDALRRDRANRYALRKPWTLPGLRNDIPDYEDDLFLIRDSFITIKPYAGDICDGATLAPDTIGNIKPLIASLFHDPWYVRVDAIARAWGWEPARVRALGDQVFYGIMAIIAPNWIASIYYRFVRRFGGLARTYGRIRRAFGVGVRVLMGVLVVASVATGCDSPESPFEDPDTFVPPVYEQTEGLNQ